MLLILFQSMDSPNTVYAISMNWFRQWQNFIRTKCDPPGPIDNSNIVNQNQQDTVKQGSDYAQISEELWLFFHRIYNGGPEIKLRQSKVNNNNNSITPVQVQQPIRSQSVTAITSSHFENLSITGAESVPEFFIPPLKPKKHNSPNTFDNSSVCHIETEKIIAPVHEPKNYFIDKEVTEINDSVTVEMSNTTSAVNNDNLTVEITETNDISIKNETHESADEISSVNENVITEYRQHRRIKRRGRSKKFNNRKQDNSLDKVGNGDK